MWPENSNKNSVETIFYENILQWSDCSRSRFVTCTFIIIKNIYDYIWLTSIWVNIVALYDYSWPITIWVTIVAYAITAGLSVWVTFVAIMITAGLGVYGILL